MINNIKTMGKFLDQPLLISKLNRAMPAIMTAGGGLFILKEANDTFKKQGNNPLKTKQELKKEVLKKSIVLTSAILSALAAPKIASKITKRAGLPKVEEVIEKNKALVDEFVKTNPCDKDVVELLEKAKEKTLSFNNVKTLIEKLNDEKGKNFINKLIPDPENIAAKDIFSEIGFLSVYGAVPVVGGILGGIGADVLVKEDNRKEKIPDKINEGLYQYLANIFMCNIGAGCALAILEKLNITSKAARAIGMTTGIILTGVLGGSKIANFISKKVIGPIIQPHKKSKERRPELMDLGLHTDDIATVSLLSGLKWIEPSLPILYTVSGYKSGIGYRN